MERVGGIIYFKIDGVQQRAKGDFTYHLGTPLRKAVVGNDGPHGYSETPQSPYIEGEVTDSKETSVEALLNVTNSTVTLDVSNGKTIVLSQAYYTGDGTVQTGEGNIKVRFDGLTATEIGGGS